MLLQLTLCFGQHGGVAKLLRYRFVRGGRRTAT